MFVNTIQPADTVKAVESLSYLKLCGDFLKIGKLILNTIAATYLFFVHFWPCNGRGAAGGRGGCGRREAWAQVPRRVRTVRSSL